MFNPENAQNEIDFLNRSESKHHTWNSLASNSSNRLSTQGRYHASVRGSSIDQAFRTRSLLEIGSGSGALSIIAAKQGWNVHACDINPYAVAATRRNAQEASVEVEVREGGLGRPTEEIHGLQAWNPGTYDLVLWNMPYIPAGEINDDVLGHLKRLRLSTHILRACSLFLPVRWQPTNSVR